MKLLAGLVLIFILIQPTFGAVSRTATTWDGPERGPVAQIGKSVIFVASDLRNGGVAATSQAFLEAAKVLKWKAQVLDGTGDRRIIRRQLKVAINSQPDGIVIGGFDALDYVVLLTSQDSTNITFIGWHATSTPGPSKYLCPLHRGC